jgi:hypothetical protein
MEMVVTARRAEQLGDLKLYRLGDPTTIAANQSKQVRLLDLAKAPFESVWSADLNADDETEAKPATRLLRTVNDKAHRLGAPLPSGAIAIFSRAGGREMLVGEPPIRDTAVGEDVELKLGESPDVQVKQTELVYTLGAPEIEHLTPELLLVRRNGRTIVEVQITNARAQPTPFELRLMTEGGQQVESPDHAMGKKDGRPIFRLTLPANGVVKLRYALSDL